VDDSRQDSDWVMHVALFRWNEGHDSDRVRGIAKALSAMAAELPQIRYYRCGPDLRVRDGSWDFAVVSVAETPEDLDAYLTHQSHREIITEQVAPILAERQSVQIGISSGDVLALTRRAD
jgi:hypothetical protein